MSKSASKPSSLLSVDFPEVISGDLVKEEEAGCSFNRIGRDLQAYGDDLSLRYIASKERDQLQNKSSRKGKFFFTERSLKIFSLQQYIL